MAHPTPARRPVLTQARVYELLDVAAPGDRLGRAIDIFMVALIVANVTVATVETIKPVYERWAVEFHVFDAISVTLFTIEYLLRLWSCTHDAAYRDPVSGRLRFALTPLALVDLLAILPFYVHFLGMDLRFLRALRLFRIFRILKLARYSAALKLIGRAIRSKKEELLVTLFILALLLLMSSSLVYYAEYDVQPDKFSSVPETMWWGVVTLTTVGYGDMYPVTVLGKLLAGFIAILGIGTFALPTAILGSAFMEQLQQKRRRPLKCPHCGQEIEEG
jgi:voltage-gated potassium channel